MSQSSIYSQDEFIDTHSIEFGDFVLPSLYLYGATSSQEKLATVDGDQAAEASGPALPRGSRLALIVFCACIGVFLQALVSLPYHPFD
jgi:hypothetical protein